MTLVLPALDFDPVTHTYRVDGRVVPNVTTVLKAVGVSVDFDALPSGAAAAAEAKRDLGAAVHQALHFHDEDDLDEARLDPQIVPYVQALQTFLVGRVRRCVALETPLYHPVYDYAGTLDRVYELADGRLVLVDFKLGDPWACAAAIQTAAYQGAWDQIHADRLIAERWAVRLIPDSDPPPYRISIYRDVRDWGSWLACLATYRLQADRRPRR